MKNDIINLLNIKDENLIITNIEVNQGIKTVYIEKKLKPEFCPICSSRMHSKGIYKREINHPILQDGFRLSLIVNQRKWKCTNPVCRHIRNDEFAFYEKYKQSTSITPYMVLYELKDLSKTAVEVSRRFFVSDTYVHYTVLQYLDIKRLPLPEYLSIDEVYLNIDNENQYALVLMDFITGDIIDILPNRLDKTTSKYFNSISQEERNRVKYLICDMYNPYINYTNRYFIKAQPIVDSFHVVQWINNKINQYINQVKKKYQEYDQKELEEKNYKTNQDYKSTKISNEVYILNNFRWVLLMNKENINYGIYRKFVKKLNIYMDTYDKEKAFLVLDDNFPKIRKLKEKYITFNNSEEQDETVLLKKLEQLILEYSNCEFVMFQEFSELLKRYKKEIINSFTRVPKNVSSNETSNEIRRLSNGPIEGFNRAPKDLKRNSRGFSNFEYTRNRLLWAFRKDEPVLGIPKTKDSVYKYAKHPRGSYKNK